MSTYEANRYNFTGANVTGIPTSAITSGTFADARLSASSVTQHVDLTALSASNLTSGTIPNARYGTPTFNGSNITNLSTTTTTGTWTPGVSSGGLTSVSGQYQKVGQFVFCQFEARMNSAPAMGSSEDNSWYMTGLPFTAKSYSTGYNGTWFPSMGVMFGRADVQSWQCAVVDNSTNFYFHNNQGWRNTQYYSQWGRGGMRNVTAYAIYNGGTNESWMYGRIFYVSAS